MMRKLFFSKESLRRLDDRTLQQIQGGEGVVKVTLGPECARPVMGDADDYANGKR